MGDAAYSGQRNVIRQWPPHAANWIQTKAHRPLSERARACNRTKSKVRAKIEHVSWCSSGALDSPKSVTAGWRRYQLALGYLLIDEFVRGSTAPVGGGIAGVCANGEWAARRRMPSAKMLSHDLLPLRGVLVDQPMSSFLSAKVNY